MPSHRSPTIDRMLVAFNARDLDGWLAAVTEDFEMESRFPFARTIFRSRAGVIAWWADLADVWDPMELKFQESADIGVDRTVLLMSLSGIGRGSGMGLDEPIAQRWYWRGDQVSKIEYLDRQEGEGIVRGQPEA